MKRYMGLIVGFVLVMQCSMVKGDGCAVEVTTTGDNSVVEAIQRCSNITLFDVNKWKLSWAPLMGDYIRSGVIAKIRSLIGVCQIMPLANRTFSTAQALIRAFPEDWEPKAVCLALKNLEKQGKYAAALLRQVGAITPEEKSWGGLINQYLQNIKHNRALFSATCTGIKRKQEAKQQKKLSDEARLLQQQQNRAAANILYWEDWKRKYTMAKDVGQNVFGGAKWMANAAYNMSVEQPGVSLLSAAALYYFYNKLFGTSYPIKR